MVYLFIHSFPIRSLPGLSFGAFWLFHYEKQWVSSFSNLHFTHYFLGVYCISLQFPLSRLQLDESLSQAFLLPLLILSAFRAFIVVFCIFEKCIRCVWCMWHQHIPCFILCFLNTSLAKKTSPQLSKQVLLLLQYFRSYSSDQRVSVWILWALALDYRGKDDLAVQDFSGSVTCALHMVWD